MRERLALALILALGAWLRLRHVASAFLFGDELHSLGALSLGWRGVLSAFDQEGSGLALPLLQKAAVGVFGPTLVALRLPALVPALVALALVPLLGRRLVSREGALLATALFSASAFLVFYARFGRSYALVACLALVLTWAAGRIAQEVEPGRGPYLALALAAGLLPWAHLSTVGFVAATGLAALVALLASPRSRPRVKVLVASLAAAVALAAVLYAPAAERALRFVGQKQGERYDGAFGPLDVVILLGGGRIVAGALLAATLAGAFLVLRERGVRGLPLALAALAPVPLVFAARPYGDPYAYARYAIAGLPAALLLAGEALALGLRALGPAAAGRTAGAAVLLAALVAGSGPLRAADDGPFANTYLGLLPLPAFDAPYPHVPPAYARLGAGSVIETPALSNRSRQVYRAHYLAQPRPTQLGFLPEEGPAPPGPHVSLLEPRRLAESADYLVVHRDPEAEAARYWRFVYEDALPRLGGERALMDRQEDWGRPLPRPSPELIERLRRRFGEPIAEDETLLVFRLR